MCWNITSLGNTAAPPEPYKPMANTDTDTFATLALYCNLQLPSLFPVAGSFLWDTLYFFLAVLSSRLALASQTWLSLLLSLHLSSLLIFVPQSLVLLMVVVAVVVAQGIGSALFCFNCGGEVVRGPMFFF